MSFRTLDGVDTRGKRALVRVDVNAPMEDGKVTDDTRLRAALPTIAKLREGGAKVILISHLGRPKGKPDPALSLKALAAPLSALIGAPVAFAADCVGEAAKIAVDALADGDVLLLENLRFHAGEAADDPAFARALAANGDLYVDDAFSAAHRAHASTDALARLLPAYAGEAMRRELEALERALGKPERPVLGVVGGAKVSTKLDLLENLTGKLDALAIGGAMANTFLLARGWDVGESVCERNLASAAREVTAAAETRGCALLLPTDVVVADKLEANVGTRVRRRGEIAAGERILDAGPESLARLLQAIDESRTLVWNGPLGVFETPPFDAATTAAARHAAARAKAGKLVAVAGGGDTVSALHHAGVVDDFTFVSTAGGAFLEWMEGKTLPGVAALQDAPRRLE